MRRVSTFAKAMEKMLSEAFDREIPKEWRGKTYGSNVVLGVHMRTVASKQIVSEDIPDPEPELPPVSDDDESDAADPSVS
jgi:hypothetical protein